MKFRTTAILFGLLVLLCLGYWVSLRWEKSVEIRDIETRRLFPFDLEDLASLSIQQENLPATVGVRDDAGGWSIVEPYSLEANPVLWSMVAKAFVDLSSDRTIEESPEDLAVYELDQPRLTVAVTMQDGEKHRIAFGKLDVYQRSRYALVGDTVVLTPDKSFTQLDRPLDLLRQVYLFENHELGIARLEFARYRLRGGNAPPLPPGTSSELEDAEESEVVAVERDSDGYWQLVSPIQSPADQELVEAMARELQFAAGRSFNDEPESLEDYNLDPPRFRFTATFGDTPPQTAYFGTFSREGEKPGIFVKREGRPAVFQIDAGMFEFVPSSPMAYAEKRLLTRNPENIQRMEFTAGDTRAVIERDGKIGWRLVSPVEERADGFAVTSYLGALSDIRGLRYIPEAHPTFGLDEPLLEIVLGFGEGEEPAVIRIGGVAPKDGRRYALQDAGSVTTLSQEACDWLAKDLFYFRDKSLLEFPTDRAVAVALTLDGTAHRFEKGTRRWDVVEPSGKVWERDSDMAALLDILAKARASGLTADVPPDGPTAYGMDSPVLDVEVTLAAGADGESETAGPLTVGAVSKTGPRQRHAIVSGRPEVFTINQDLIDKVREVLGGIRDQ